MMSFLTFHKAAAARGDGLRPELLALVVRAAAAPHVNLVSRDNDIVRSDPNPAPIDVIEERANVLRFPRPSVR
jgi:hypothetical protein